MTAITMFLCADPEQAIYDSLMADNEREQAERDEAEDRAYRFLAGSCDGCQQHSKRPLVEYRMEALCVGCCEAIGPRVYEQAARGTKARMEPGQRLG